MELEDCKRDQGDAVKCTEIEERVFAMVYIWILIE